MPKTDKLPSCTQIVTLAKVKTDAKSPSLLCVALRDRPGIYDVNTFVCLQTGQVLHEVFSYQLLLEHGSLVVPQNLQ